ncbi:MAG: DUF433 domain-containing protein [Gemmatimonadota bacterium]
MATPARSTAATIDTRDQPAYSPTEAARYLKVPDATLRSWIIGRPYPKGHGVAHSVALIKPASKQPTLLSFWNLVEAHVLRALRTDHGVALRAVRQALTYAEKSMKIDRLLLRNELRTDAGQLFLQRYGQLINLSASDQLAMRKLFDKHLKRVEWDQWQFPVRLYPFVSSETETIVMPIAIDSTIAFGRPVVKRLGISTSTIADRIDAGESVSELAGDYDLSIAEIEQAVLYERAA